MSASPLPPILLVGGGKMGAALLAGWREQGLPTAIVIDPSPEAQKLTAPGINVYATPADIPHGFTPEAVILAIKPQMAAAASPSYARFANSALFVSIMAGKTLHAIAAMLGAKAAIVRAMPNTPAAIRQSFTVAVPNHLVSAADQALATQLLAAAGELAWVADEALLDPVTAISGGGPAYLFLLTELLEQTALAQGIPAPLARAMARQTIIGSAALLAASDQDAATLREAVTSPAGTTERALAVLRAEHALPKLFQDAIEAATQRSRELGG
jgi:pyrroline-5-carboxylate reductase